MLVGLVEHGGAVLGPGTDRTVVTEGEAWVCEADNEFAFSIRSPATIVTLQLDRPVISAADKCQGSRGARPAGSSEC